MHTVFNIKVMQARFSRFVNGREKKIKENSVLRIFHRESLVLTRTHSRGQNDIATQSELNALGQCKRIFRHKK